MASIEEIRAGIDAANAKANEAKRSLQQAGAQLEEAQTALAQVTEGSTQGDVNDANGQLAQAIERNNETLQLVGSAISTAEGISARL
jgi:uncharacterized protein YukE